MWNICTDEHAKEQTDERLSSLVLKQALGTGLTCSAWQVKDNVKHPDRILKQSWGSCIILHGEVLGFQSFGAQPTWVWPTVAHLMNWKRLTVFFFKVKIALHVSRCIWVVVMCSISFSVQNRQCSDVRQRNDKHVCDSYVCHCSWSLCTNFSKGPLKKTFSRIPIQTSSEKPSHARLIENTEMWTSSHPNSHVANIMEQLNASITQPRYSNAFCSTADTTLAFVLLQVHV